MSELPSIEDIVGPGFTEDARTSRAAIGRYYTDPVVHQIEQDRVFGHEWNYLGHHSELPDPGNYLVRDVAGESIYVIRGKDDELRAFFNVCQHRGHQLLQGQGTIGNVVVCPYHAWSYGTDGTLRGAPKMRHVPDFCAADVALTPVRLELIGGFMFANLDPDAPSLREMAPRFEPALLSMVAESADLHPVRTRSFEIAANWKVVTENFLEAYHVEFSGPAHQGLARVIDTETYEFDIDGRTIEYRAAGGAPDTLPYQSNPHDAFTNTANAPFQQIFLFPHTTFSVFPGTNLVFVYNMAPNGVDRCAEEITYFTLDAEMTEPSRTAEAYISEQLNEEDIALVEAVQRGVGSRGYRPGRLMVDAEEEEGWSEHFVHHFNQLNVAALRRHEPSSASATRIAAASASARPNE